MDSDPNPPPRLPLPAALLLVALAALAGVNGLGGEFLYDDFPYVVENSQVQEGGLREALGEPLARRPELGLYRPLAVLSYQWQADGQGAEASPTAFRVFNLALHVAVTVLVALLGLRLGLAGGSAVAGAALFAVHPCHVEVISWIVGRAEMIAAGFGVAFLIVALRPAGLARDLGAAALWFLACLGKEGALALPGVLLLVDAFGGPEARRGAGRRYALLALSLAAVVWIRWSVLGRFAPDVGMAAFGGTSLLERLPVCANLAGSYLAKILWPWPDRIFYHSSEFLGFQWVSLLPLAFAAGLWFLVRRSARHWLLLLAFFGTLLPVLNLKPIQETFALRFLYTPSLFACLLLGDGIAAVVRREIARRGRAGGSLALPSGLVVVGLSLSWLGNGHWGEATELWIHNLRAAPRVEVGDHPGIPAQFPYRDRGFPFHHYQVADHSYRKELYLPRDGRKQGAKIHFLYALHASDELEERGLKGMPFDQRARAHLYLARMYSRLLPRGQRNPPLAEEHARRAEELGKSWKHLSWEWSASLLELALLRGRVPTIDPTAARGYLLFALQIPELDPEAGNPIWGWEDLRRSIEAELRRVEAEIEGRAGERESEREDGGR